MLMKDGLGLNAAKRVAHAMSSISNDFDSQGFVNYIDANVAPLELKQRVELFIDGLKQYLPDDFAQCYELLMKIKPHWDYGDPNDPIRSFAAWPITDFVAKHGLSSPDLSFSLMKELTELFSAEFAIRYFIKQDTSHAFHYLDQWVDDSNHHVRRLVSEGTRPRLPWGIRLNEFCKDPSPCIPLLEKLKNDPSEYVRRSVANHLNDIAKDNPQIVIKLCQQWSTDASEETKWVIKHACRSLIKFGHKEVFPLLGFSEEPEIETSDISLVSDEVKLGGKLDFSFAVTSTAKQPQKLAVDFIIHHVKANGQRSPKVFKLKELTLKPYQSVELTKRHPMKAITTRKYYAGEHLLEIQINGKALNQTPFNFTL